jgi:SAM-dependent methyltransferase
MCAIDRTDPDEHARRLAGESLAVADPTGWFERLYAAAAEGEATVPWDRGGPHPLLEQWAQARGLDGHGFRAVVVGCGLGGDAAYIAGLGFDTVAFDVAASAIESARWRFPESPVQYRTANLLDLPDAWSEAFDLVIESLTVQSLPDAVRPEAIANVGKLVAPGGTLIVVATARGDEDSAQDGPPWPLSRAEINAFATGGLRSVRIESLPHGDQPSVCRWRAEFRR